MERLITSESVSKGHPDKIADQISDSILDAYLRKDSNSKVAVETMVKDNCVVLGGEVKSCSTIDIDKTVRDIVKKIGYTKPKFGFYYKDLTIINLIGKQSVEINKAVEKEEVTSGDQGFMIGYATNETPNMMPIGMYMSKLIVDYVSEKEGLGPDAKSQVTVKENSDKKIHTILVSTMHDENISLKELRKMIIEDILTNKMKLDEDIFNLIDDDTQIVVNPAGSWNIGGPRSDCGLTGRKIVVDQYGPYSPVGGGAFCFPENTKVKMKNSYKEIQNINIGDKVWSFNEESKKLELKEVNEVYSKSKEESYDLLEITLENGKNIKVTENHEINTKRGWVKAKDLNPTDTLISFENFNI